MKKIFSITCMILMLSSVSAFAELNLNPDGTTSTALGSSNTTFRVSTNVQLRAAADDTHYTAASKHVAGGIHIYGTTEATDIVMGDKIEPDDEVAAQTAGSDPVLTAGS